MPTTGEAQTTTFTTPSDREVVMTRVFDAPRELVFEAWTNPEHLRKWLLGMGNVTMPVCDVDLRPGGQYRYGWRDDAEWEMEITGVYQEVAPPERIVSIDSWGGDWPETTNTVVFEDMDGMTKMTHTILFPSKEARDAALETGMNKGMAASVDRLAKLLAELRAA